MKPHEWERIDGVDAIGASVFFQWWCCKHCGTTARSAMGVELTDVDVLVDGLSVDCDEQLVESVHQH